MKQTLNYDLTNPTPFIKKFIQKHSHTINKYSDLLFSDDLSPPDHPFNSEPKLIQKLAWELSYFRLINDDLNYYL